MLCSNKTLGGGPCLLRDLPSREHPCNFFAPPLAVEPFGARFGPKIFTFSAGHLVKPVMGIGVACDLRRMRYGQHLRLFSKPCEPLPDRRGGRTANACVYLVE